VKVRIDFHVRFAGQQMPDGGALVRLAGAEQETFPFDRKFYDS